MVDYQFLGRVAVVLAVVTGGSLVPVIVVTGLTGLMALVYEAGVRRYRRRHPGPGTPPGRAAAAPPEGDLTRWMAAVERVLGSHD